MFSSLTVRAHARNIWQAGVDTVRSDRLVRERIRVEGDTTTGTLWLGPHAVSMASFDRVCVVGGGKAVAAMAVALEAALEPISKQIELFGWVNVPDDCLLPTTLSSRAIHLHAARPAGSNEPTQAAAEGTNKILSMVAELGPRDLCIVLISGGGSALLPAPVEGITLEDKLAVTRMLSATGADIHQLNTVRKQLSRIKGGGLAQTCRAGQVVSLIISDVLGDPLDVIASGPTVENPTTAADALTVLESFSSGSGSSEVPDRIWDCLKSTAKKTDLKESKSGNGQSRAGNFDNVTNLILANNDTALAACAAQAEELGYRVETLPTNQRESHAEAVGEELVELALKRCLNGPDAKQPLCILSGGEPIVQLAPAEQRGRGGRNQQLVLAALQRMGVRNELHQVPFDLTFLSGGTDGEDGPTDAAGSILWPDLIKTLRLSGLKFDQYLARNDAYTLLGALDALIKTGPTHTNVCDIRVLLITPQ